MKVEINNLVVDYSGVHALNGASCEFRRGCVNGLIGPNGAGKSTLLNAVTGAVRPASGRIDVDGENTTGQPAEKIRLHGVARTFQVPKLHDGLSVLDNVVIGLPPPRLRLRPWLPWHPSPSLRARRAAGAAWLERFGESDLVTASVKDLTLPQQRIIELVRAFAAHPRLVMLDEPSSGLGVEEAERILRGVLELVPEEGTMVLISHDVELVFNFATWIVVMAEGRVLAQGMPEDIRCNSRVRKAYLGEAM